MKLMAAIPLYWCIGPPIPCETLTTLHTMTMQRDAHNHIVLTVNGHDYGAVTSATRYAVPNSIVVPDALFKSGFD